MFFGMGILLFLGGMAGIGMGGKPQDFIDVPSLGIVGMATIGLLCVGHGCTVPIMPKALFSSSMTAEQLLDAARAWRASGSYAVWSGFVAVLIGAIIMARNITDLSGIGAPFAICIMTSLYGSIWLVLARACADRIQGRAEDLKE